MKTKALGEGAKRHTPTDTPSPAAEAAETPARRPTPPTGAMPGRGDDEHLTALHAIGDSTLRAAATRVARAWVDARGEAADDAEVYDLLAELASTIAARRDHLELEGMIEPDVPRLRTPLGRRLVDLLRAELIRTWSRVSRPAANPREMLPTLAAIEQIREASEPDWADYFVSKLSDPGAHDLLVELTHDLRSPLTSVLFLAETLLKGRSGPLNDIQRRQLGLVYAAAFGLNTLTNDVIELARNGTRLIEQEPTPFSVAEMLDSVREIVAPLAEEKGIEVRILRPHQDSVLGHPLALSRILLNLTTNALKFTSEGHVEVSARDGGDGRMQFSVRDTGDGINPASLATLYQPFRRNRGREGYGFSSTGLGLAICRKLVETLGSSLELESLPGQGTRFFFMLRLPPTETS